jgi:hypothetical protein
MFKLKLQQKIRIWTPVPVWKMLVWRKVIAKRASAEPCAETAFQESHLMTGRIPGDLTNS